MREVYNHDAVIDLKVGEILLAEAVPISLGLERRGGDLILMAVNVRDHFSNAYEEIAKGCTKPLEQAIWAMAEYILKATYSVIEDEIAAEKMATAA